MVGHRGIEPRDTCVSGPVDQLGRGQQMAEVPTRRSRAVPGSSRSRPPGRFAIRERRAEVLNPTASRRPPVFETEPAARQVHSPWRKTVDTIHRAFTPPAFQTGTTTWWFHLPRRRAGDSNATVLPAHPLATEPGTLAGSPSMSGRAGVGTGAPRGTYRPARSCFPRLTTCPTRDSNSEPLPSEGSASTKLG
jgi:hypothetical protein